MPTAPDHLAQLKAVAELQARATDRVKAWTEFFATLEHFPLAAIAEEVERGRRAIRLLRQLKKVIASTTVNHGHGMTGTLLDFDDKLQKELAALTKEPA